MLLFIITGNTEFSGILLQPYQAKVRVNLKSLLYGVSIIDHNDPSVSKIFLSSLFTLCCRPPSNSLYNLGIQ